MDELQMNREEWRGVESSLSAMIPEYDDTNNRISFGLIDGCRDRVVDESRGGKVALEIGSGPGTLAVKLLSEEIICLDALREMHETARKRIPKERLDKYRFVVASGEAVPLADESVDVVYCAFSFRDFHNKKEGISEICRVLRKGGRLIILDAAKYNKIHGMFMHFYLNNIAPFLAPKSRDSIKSLARTYKAFGTPAYYARLIKERGVSSVNVKYLSLGLAFTLTAIK